MKIRGLFAVMFVLVSGMAAQAPTRRPMTFADLMAMKRVSDPQVSPSGKWVLFSVTDVSLEKNTKTNHLWSVPLEAGKREQGLGIREDGAAQTQVTFGSGESNGRFSPDGKWVMYSANDAKGSGQIFVAAWDEAKGAVGEGHAVTALETEADGAIWAPDSKHFLFVSDVYPECEAPAGPGKNEAEAECNAAKDAAAAKSPVKALIFTELLYRHWDHFQGAKRTHLFWGVVGDAGEKQILSEDDNKKGKGNGEKQVLRRSAPQDDKSGIAAPKDLTPMSVVGDHVAPTYAVGAPLGYAIAPGGKEVAYVVNLDKVPAESTNNDIFVLDPEGDVHAAKKVSTSPGSDDGPQYSPDGKWLAWRSQERNGYESDLFELVVMDRTSGSIKELAPVRGTNQQGEVVGDNWVDEFAWSPDSLHIAYASPDRGHEVVQVIQLQPGLPNRWSAVDGELGSLTFAPDGSLAATRMTVSGPAEIVVIRHTSGMEKGYDIVQSTTDVRTLSHANDALVSKLILPKVESFWFAGANGTKVQGFLIRPPNFDPAKKYPLKFLIHGGPQGAWGDAWSYRWNPELFVADGYVVVMINPRGSTGYGQKFLEEVSGDWGGRPYVDLMKGLDYAEAKYPFIDKTRECALGASYGGFMANWVLTHTNRFKCIVTHDGMYNPQAAFGDTEELWFNEWEFRPLAGARGQGAGKVGATTKAGPSPSAPDDNKGSRMAADDRGDAVVLQGKPAHPWDFYDKPASEDPFRRWSPMLNIRNAKTPTLVVHSQRDYRLDVSEGMQLFTALQLLGVPSKMLYFPDEGHWVLKPQNSELWYRTVNDWCDQWTRTGKYAK